MTQMPSQGVRRHPNGSIDVDFYRTRAAALRGQAKRDAATAKAVCAFVLTMVSALSVAVLLVAASAAYVPDRQAAAVQSSAQQIR